MDHAPTGSSSPSPSGSPPVDHDANAEAVVKRFLDGEATTVPQGNQPLEPTMDGDTKVFELTIDPIQHKIDAQKDPIAALGFNGTWPGPRLTVVEGDKVRAIFKNNMDESTGIHFHGQRLPNAMDGVPHVTQAPIQPGESFTYEFVAKTTGSHMYHSHHNATDQVGRGLLGAFIVQPKDEADRYENLYGASQDIIWISNDVLGGFTINGHGFPATAPIVANLGDTIVIRFMNEGTMSHPWHLHGVPMRVVARDGYPLGPAAFTCDTLGRQPRRTLGRGHQVRRAGRLGLPLPHPPARRGDGRDVRDGHGARRRRPVGDRRDVRRGGLDDGDPVRLSDPDRRMSAAVDAQPRKILLATDLSSASASATDEAFAMARRLGAELLIVSVIDPASSPASGRPFPGADRPGPRRARDRGAGPRPTRSRRRTPGEVPRLGGRPGRVDPRGCGRRRRRDHRPRQPCPWPDRAESCTEACRDASSAKPIVPVVVVPR